MVSSLEQAIEGEEEPGEDEDGRIDEHGEEERDEERDEEPILCHVRAYKGIGLFQAQLRMRQRIRRHRNHDQQKEESQYIEQLEKSQPIDLDGYICVSDVNRTIFLKSLVEARDTSKPSIKKKKKGKELRAEFPDML